MAIEIEKKYRLSEAERARVIKRLPEIGAEYVREEFEENTLYSGGEMDFQTSVLRLRRVGNKAILTFKERFPSTNAIKHQREEETRVADADAMAAILDGLGFHPAVVYEKRRATWRLANAEVVVDELPFGFFVEIEGEEKAIESAEKLLGLESAIAEMATYPQLALEHGKNNAGVIEARF